MTTTPTNRSMRAVLHDRYGTSSVLRLGKVAIPEIGDHDVLIDVRAAGLDRGTEHLMTGKPYAMRLATGIGHPRNPVPGRDVSGVVTDIGRAVTRFTIGDEVYGIAPGSFAEYALARETQLARKPANLSFAEAAVVPVSAGTALRALADVGHVQAGQAAATRSSWRRRSEPRSRASAAPPRPTWSPHWEPTTSSTTTATTSPTGRGPTTWCSTSPATRRCGSSGGPSNLGGPPSSSEARTRASSPGWADSCAVRSSPPS